MRMPSGRKLLFATVSSLSIWAGSAGIAAAQSPPINVDEVLTEEVTTRILGFEKDELSVPAGGSADAVQAMQIKRRLLAEGVVAFRAGDGDGAQKKFQEAVAADASLPPADVFLARLCFAVNDPNVVRLGINVLNRAAGEHPEAPEPFLMFGQLALLEGRLTDADALFAKAETVLSARAATLGSAKLAQYKKNAYGGRVSVCEQRQNWAEGIVAVDAWIALDANDPVALFRKARLVFLQDPKDTARLAEARKLFDEAYQTAVRARKNADELPSVPPTELALLELQSAVGNLDQARSEIAQIDKKSSEWEADRREGSRVYSTVSQWYLGRGEFSPAESYAAKATTLDRDSQALKQLTAVLHYYSGDKRAEAEFTEMNQEKPDDFFAANFLALALSDAMGDDGAADDAKRAKAVRLAEINARLNPKSPVALSTLGWAYFNTGRLGEAAQLFAALEQQQNLQVTPDTAYFMAKTFAALPSAQFPNALPRSKSLLELAVNAGGAFRYRTEATTWLAALEGSSGATRGTPAATGPAVSGTTTLTPAEKKE